MVWMPAEPLLESSVTPHEFDQRLSVDHAGITIAASSFDPYDVTGRLILSNKHYFLVEAIGYRFVEALV